MSFYKKKLLVACHLLQVTHWVQMSKHDLQLVTVVTCATAVTGNKQPRDT